MFSNSSIVLTRTPDNQNYQVNSKGINDAACPQSNLIPTQAANDEQLISLWIHGRSSHTQRAYLKDISDFLNYVQKGITGVILLDLQKYSDYLISKKLSSNSIRRTLSSIKSLFSFGQKIGYLKFDIGKPFRISNCRDTLSQRILSQDEIKKIIESVKNYRNKMIIKMLYFTGIRISELVSLKWKDLKIQDKGAILSIFGKGNKNNNLLISEDLLGEILILNKGSNEDDAIFKSRKGGHLDGGYIRQIIKGIGIKAVGKAATPHWFRHSHASHALDNGCPIHLVQKQLNHSSIATTGRYLHAKPTESSSEYLK